MKILYFVRRVYKRIRNHLYNQNIQKFLFTSCIAVTAAALLLSGFISYNTMKKSVYSSIEEYYKTNNAQVRERFFHSSKEIRDFSERLARDSAFIESLKYYGGADIVKQYDLYKDLKNAIYNKKIFYNDIHSIDIYYKNYKFSSISSNVYKIPRNIKEMDLFKSIVADGQTKMFDIIDDKEMNIYTSSMSFAAVIRDSEDDNPIGLAIIVMNENWLDKIFGSNNVVLYNKGLIWSSRDEFNNLGSEIGKVIKNDFGEGDIFTEQQKYRLYYTKTDYQDLYIGSIMEYSFYNEQYKKAIKWLLITFAVISVLSFYLSKKLSGFITKPINRLIKEIELYGVNAKANINDMVFDKRINLRRSIAYYYTFMIFLSVFIFVSSFSLINLKIINENITKISSLSVEQAVNDLDSFIEMNDRMSINLAYSEAFHNYLTQQGGLNNTYIYDVKKEIEKFFTITDRVFDVNFFDMDGAMNFSTLLSLNTRLGEDVKQKITDNKGKVHWKLLDKDLNNRNVLTQTRLIMNVKPQKGVFELNKKLGFLQVSFEESELEDFYRNLNHNGNSAYITDQNGIIISHLSKQLVGMDSKFRPDSDRYTIIKNSESGSKTLFIALKSKQLPMYVIYEAQMNNAFTGSNNVITPGIILLAVFLIISMLYGNKVSHFIVYQLSFVQAKMFSGNIDNFRLPIKSIHINEIKFMAATFNEMSNRINELIEKVYIGEIKRKDLDMSVLQAQINPHFLCNTLETINCFIDNDQPDDAKAMMTLLKNLFNVWVHDDSIPIALEEEIMYTRSYIEIQKRRFVNMIMDEWFIDDTLNECKIPKFVLQPVVENCLYHGNAERRSQIAINVYCFEMDGNVILRVVDNGDGMDKERLTEVRDYLKGESGDSSIGLYNVNKRIKIFYGEQYGITIDSKPDKGTIVDIIFPRT